jgi:predicted outer membrane repeat protein
MRTIFAASCLAAGALAPVPKFLRALQAESTQCAGQLDSFTALVELACCSDVPGGGGHRRAQSCDVFPSTCTKFCASTFVPFVDDCTPQLMDAGVDVAGDFSTFYNLCSDAMDTHTCAAGSYEFQRNDEAMQCVDVDTNLRDAGMMPSDTGTFFVLFYGAETGEYGRTVLVGTKTIELFGRSEGVGLSDTRVVFNGRIQAMSSGMSLTMDGLTFRGQVSTGAGGAFSLVDHAMASVVNCVFDQNTAIWYGGAISVTAGSSLNVVDSVFTANHATWYGGAISLRSDSYLSISGSRFSANDATDTDAADQSVELGDAIYYPMVDGTELIYTDQQANDEQPIV